MSEDRFSLKDHLFNKEKVTLLAAEIAAVYPRFQDNQFVSKVLKKFPELELMERVYWIRDCLREYLPTKYEAAVGIILKSLPPPCDPTLSDDDFGDFIYAPYGYFVAEYGCKKELLDKSLPALRELTKRFSVEGPIRYFLNAFPEETMAALEGWVVDEHYHVRRLVSEGTRPKLPWAKAVMLPHTAALPFLDVLHADKTRFVTRSVANHLNDISKTDPDVVIDALKRWHKANLQDKKELQYITRHALRTLVKQGNLPALQLLGFSLPEVAVENFKVSTEKVLIGDSLQFSFDVVSDSLKKQKIMIDYILYFRKATGEWSPKVHKITTKEIAPGEFVAVCKKHPLRPMTTRKLYPGVHAVELQINGQKFGWQEFVLE